MGRRAPCAAGLAGLAALAALGAGCGGGGGGGDHARTAPLVAFTDAPPADLRAGDSPPAPRCRASQLRVEGRGFQFTAALVGGTGSVRLRNAGPRPCRLSGRPSVRFVGATRAPRQRQVALPADPVSFPDVAPPASTLRALAPGAAAALGVEWRNWCIPGATRAGGKLVAPRAVRVTLPGGGSLDVPYNAVATCVSPGRPSTIGVRPFQPAPLEGREPWTTAAVDASIGRLSGDRGPLRARSGTQLRYAVTLRNTSASAPVRFDRCPAVAEMLAPSGHPEVHALNCRAARPIAPGGRLRFEMRIAVPADAPLGVNGLFWELDPGGAQAPTVVSRVIVGQ